MFIRILSVFVFSHFCFGALHSVAFGQQPAPEVSTLHVIPPAPPPVLGPRWPPPDVDATTPAVDTESTCQLDAVLSGAARKIQEFVENVQKITATETLLHETINKAGSVAGTEHRTFEYLVSIQELRPGSYGVEEFRRSGSSNIVDYPGGQATKGLPALMLIFHPFYAGDFAMTCEGLGTLNGKKVWQVYFRQREDKRSRIRSYRIGSDKVYSEDLKGRAWFLADNYQIAALQTDLIHPVPEIQLVVDHTLVEYAPVHFSSRNLDIWLPKTADVYGERKGKRFHRSLGFSDFYLFAVDDKQKIGAPTPIPYSQ